MARGWWCACKRAHWSPAGWIRARPDVRDALARASLNLSDTELDPSRPSAPGTEVISRSFGSASQVLGEAVMEVNLDAARDKLRHRWLATGIAAIALATVLLLAGPGHRLGAAPGAAAQCGGARVEGHRPDLPAPGGRSPGTARAFPFLHRHGRHAGRAHRIPAPAHRRHLPPPAQPRSARCACAWICCCWKCGTRRSGPPAPGCWPNLNGSRRSWIRCSSWRWPNTG